VLARAGAYVAEFQRRLSGIVAEEVYVQDFRQANAPPDRPLMVAHRELTSDLLLVRPAGADRYVEYRDVFAVDGRPVRDRRERMQALLLSPGVSSRRQLQQIIDESARFNIGNIERTVNTPTLALSFLLPANQERFRFERIGNAAPAAADPRTGGDATPFFRVATEMWAVEYRERRSPTFIRSPRGVSIRSRGRFWIDPSSGLVLMSELVAEDPNVSATIEVSYQSAPLLGMLVPAAMREHYAGRRDGATLEGLATYRRFREFAVEVDERLDIPLPPPR
jgi:hypothetical protein